MSESKKTPSAHVEAIFTDDALDPVYQTKARILNDAVQDIGMGRYQWSVHCLSLLSHIQFIRPQGASFSWQDSDGSRESSSTFIRYVHSRK